MFGRIVACLALLTGLAVAGTPANASVAEVLNCEIGIAADSSEQQSDQQHACHHDEGGDRVEEGDRAPRPADRSRRTMRPPVLYGIDRAYE